MTHQRCHEWGKVRIGAGGFSRVQADALLAVAEAHPAGGRHGARILHEYRGHLHAGQVVGVIAIEGAVLEILPKLDPHGPGEDNATVQARLVHMLDVALGLDLTPGAATTLARQEQTLLDVLIRLFADQLLGEVRRGLPRQYVLREDNLPALRGRLDVARQFMVNAARPDRLSCRFDSLESDTALMRVMKACVLFLSRQAQGQETQRRLYELRAVLADIPDVPASRLPWDRVQIDRTNRRWRGLLDMARLFLRREWQATHHDVASPGGLSLLFPMNDLFEDYVAALLQRAMAGTDLEVVAQGGLRACLGNWVRDVDCTGQLFSTRPDILLRRGTQIVAVIDTKWKRLSADLLDAKLGVGQADVYQLMAYARLYGCARLMLLYPAVPGEPAGERAAFGIARGRERLGVATLDLARARDGDHRPVIADLSALVRDCLRTLAA